MKLFSKRNTVSGLSTLDERRIGPSLHSRRTELLSAEARNRLISEIKFLSSSDDFLEWFILFENQKKSAIFFDSNKVDSFSLAELGYKMSDYFEFENFKMVELERKLRYASGDERPERYFDDFRLFDLCEITILFAEKSQRQNVIDRINSILLEENSGFLIIEQLIARKDGESLKSLVTLIKDENLQEKIRQYYSFEEHKDYKNAAKISADVINIVFSGIIKGDKKAEITKVKQRLSLCLVGAAKKNEEKRLKFEEYLDQLLQTSKNLTNDIYDIRHTEKSTIEVKNDNIYKLVANHNIAIVELVLTTLKADYVFSSDWEAIKQEYIDKYKIDPTVRLTIVKPAPNQPINLDDIPF